nr:RelA/SpoT domain-containing protein [Acinetobacter pittii]
MAEIIAVTLKNSLISQKISFVDVPFRHKTKKSFLKKIKDKLSEKNYSPASMTDLAGIRVITLIEADVQKVCDLISRMFNVHQADSVNKSENLGEEKVGYRSVHFVCDVGEDREKMPEFSAYKGLCFEIQVRTALEHAWAEIEHDRGYKLGGKLPSHLNRRFKLLSGLLESADLEFNRLTVEIEEYAKQLNENIKNDKLNYELTSIGLKTLLKDKYTSIIETDNINDLEINKVTKELNSFGISNLEELDRLITEYKDKFDFTSYNTPVKFFTMLMFLIDIKKYFKNVYDSLKLEWNMLTENNVNFLEEKYKRQEIENIFKEYNIKILDIDAA